MLDFKTMGAVASLLKNKDKLRESGEELKRRLAEIRATGEAGGGVVRVTASGDMKIVGVEIAPAACAGADDQSRSMLQDLIAEATNHALSRARALAQGEIARMANELGLPDIGGLTGLLPMG